MLQRPCARVVSPELALITALHQLDVVLIGDAGPALPHAEVVPRDAAVRPVVPILVPLQAGVPVRLLKKVPVHFFFLIFLEKIWPFYILSFLTKEKIDKFHQIYCKM
jgi:hypothetical protein